MTTTEAPSEAKQETWLDWLAPDQPEPKPLITREELVERIRKLGVKASPGDLRYWEAAGILPRAVKRWHDGATRALYPEWMPYLVVSLREYQHEGLPLEEIARRLRASFYRSITIREENSAKILGHEAVHSALITYARRLRMRTGVVPGSVEIRAYDRGGEVIDRRRMYLSPGDTATE